MNLPRLEMGMKAQLNALCDRFDQFEKKAIRAVAIGASLPGSSSL
ncbi:MAG: hypothetical protein WCQ16_04375 [Verrucomicrobiae bacterium]